MKKTLALILAIVMALGCMSITAFAKTGAGTENDPYLFTSLEVNDIIIATDYVKNDTEDILDYEVRFINQETKEPGKWALQPDPGQTVQFTFNDFSNDTQFIYKGFDETALYGGGGYVFEIAPVPTQKIGGNAEITGEITAADFGYTMVIPTATTLTEANHENVLLGTDGKVSIKDIKHPTDKVIVSYTVDLTNGNLTDGTNTINATYKYKQGDAEFAAIDGTTKVTVYANKTINDSFVNVTANKDQWNAAPAGTYNASVTFNFEAEEAVCAVNPEEYTMLLKIVAIEDDDVYTAMYNYANDAFTLTDNDCDCYTKDDLVSLGITECAIGDCFHVDGTTFDTVKCTSPDELGITDIVFSVDNSGTKYYYSVPVGTSYSISNGMLTCTGILYEGGTDFTWTLNGEAAPASGTIQNNDAFVGTPAN